MNAVFEFKNVGFKVADKDVLKGLTLTIPKGACYCFVGSSGAGKSSVIRLMNRLNVKTAGEILFSGNPIESYDVQALRRKIGFVFQHAALFEGTVEDNLRLALEFSQECSEDLAQQRLMEVLQLSGLTANDLSRNALKMSGGEQQRVGIARALMTNPEVLCLDEPTASLDIEASQIIINTIKALREEKTVVMICHELEVVRQVATHVAMIDKGGLVEVAPCREFFENPKAERTIQFLNAYQRYLGQKE